MNEAVGTTLLTRSQEKDEKHGACKVNTLTEAEKRCTFNQAIYSKVNNEIDSFHVDVCFLLHYMKKEKVEIPAAVKWFVSLIIPLCSLSIKQII